MRKLLLCCVLAVSAWAADFKTGLDAFNRGDYAAALKEWQPIADAGDANAQYNLGLMYARGNGVPQDYPKAAEWYTKAAEQGVPAAQYNLGVMYANGNGVPASAEQASKWFLKAAEAGITDAQTGLGSIYYEGEGAFRNYSEAEKWYRKAAEQGVTSAAFHLGVMYDLGQGVRKDYAEAVKWYQKAADGGYAAAMANLGILYYNAQGVNRDLIQAYTYFDKAQKLGDPRAPELLSATSKKLTPKDLKKAQEIAASWAPKQAQPTQVADTKLFKGSPEPQTAAVAATAPAKAQAQPRQGEASRTVRVPDSAPAQEHISAVFTGVSRVVAIGDLHGDYEQFTSVLASAGLIDGNGDWTGGAAHLVQTGDVVDRGPDSRAIMDLLMKLEKQAAAAGGGIHALVGNHEAMNVYGDLRYTSPGEFASYALGNGTATTYSYAAQAALTAAAKPVAPAGNTVGYPEHRAAFGPNGVYGKWIRSHPAVVKIDRTLFVHAGLGEKFADWTIDRINDEVHRELNDFSRLHGGIATDEEGPLWYRGLASGDEQQLQPLIDRLLQHFDVDRIVVGHTYARAAITPRFGGKVVLIDIGLSRVYDNVGKMGCLEITGDQAVAIHRGQKLPLPKDENGPDMLRYLKEAASLDPPPSPLQSRIAELEKK